MEIDTIKRIIPDPGWDYDPSPWARYFTIYGKTWRGTGNPKEVADDLFFELNVSVLARRYIGPRLEKILWIPAYKIEDEILPKVPMAYQNHLSEYDYFCWEEILESKIIQSLWKSCPLCKNKLPEEPIQYTRRGAQNGVMRQHRLHTAFDVLSQNPFTDSNTGGPTYCSWPCARASLHLAIYRTSRTWWEEMKCAEEKETIKKLKPLMTKVRKEFRKSNPDALALLQKEFKLLENSPV
jgi:hypothetical protein